MIGSLPYLILLEYRQPLSQSIRDQYLHTCLSSGRVSPSIVKINRPNRIIIVEDWAVISILVGKHLVPNLSQNINT